jgi:LPXTG-motif cell wall-anchored protein
LVTGAPAGADTIDADDGEATLTLIKVVVGGTAAPDDFALTIDGMPVLSGVATPVAPGVHAAAETQLEGYVAGSWGGDCSPDGTVTVAAGENGVCTITNTLTSAPVEPATLTVVKTVVGGTAAPDDFALTIDGTPVLSGVATPMAAGDHQVAETQLDGYVAGSWGGDCMANGTVIVRPGENRVCTITNTYTEQSTTTTSVTTTTQADSTPSELPRTGADTPLPLAVLAGIGVALLGGGLLAAIAARRSGR